MTTSETMTEVTRRSQEAFASAVQIWADSLQRFVGLLPASDATVPSADEVVDRAYDFAAQALATAAQRSEPVVKALVCPGEPPRGRRPQASEGSYRSS